MKWWLWPICLFKGHRWTGNTKPQETTGGTFYGMCWRCGKMRRELIDGIR